MSPQRTIGSSVGSKAYVFDEEAEQKQVPRSARAGDQAESDGENNYVTGQVNTEPEEHPFRKLENEVKGVLNSAGSANSSTANWLHGTPRN